ncbi:MAG: hypothetical protein CR982_04590 [Candidatus Cloacimonadota bacterium]|nr:MAG: hypothetical protein CR982_04590 [Candidatus Cloacimonadota bacterium]PIE78928.1 MAG: hypothetical protein CSA15_05295 [Candidatus Delongbacteria bacterium]
MSNKFIVLILIITSTLLANPVGFDLKYSKLNNELDSLQSLKFEELKNIKRKLDRIIDRDFKLTDKRISPSKRNLLAKLIFRVASSFHDYEEYVELKQYNKIVGINEILASSKELNGEDIERLYNMLKSIAPNLTRRDLLNSERDLLDLYKPQYDNSLYYYNLLTNKFPESEYTDDALFNKAFINYEVLKKPNKAISILKNLLKKYPESNCSEASNFILGEYYFDPERNPTNDLVKDSMLVRKSISYYREVVNRHNTEKDYYYNSLFRLAFCYYRTYSFDLATKYLTRTIEELYERYGESVDADKENMLNLCIEYLAFSFRDRPWKDENMSASSLKEHIATRDDMGKKALSHYGSEIFKKLGYIYKDGGDYDLAIASFDSLLNLYPGYENAPLIQEEIIKSHEENITLEGEERERKLYSERNRFFSKFKRGQYWDRNNRDKRKNLSVDSLISKNMLLNINNLQVRAQKSNNKEMFAETVSLINGYINELPSDSNCYRLKWYKGSILGNNLNKPLESYEIFMDLSRDSLTTSFKDKDSGLNLSSKKAARNAIIMAGKIRKLEQSKTKENE